MADAPSTLSIHLKQMDSVSEEKDVLNKILEGAIASDYKSALLEAQGSFEAPALRLNAVVYGVQPEYTEYRESMLPFDRLLEQQSCPVALDDYFSGISLTDNAKQLCAWASANSVGESNMQLMNSYYGAESIRSEEDGEYDALRFEFFVGNMIDGFSNGREYGEINTGVSMNNKSGCYEVSDFFL